MNTHAREGEISLHILLHQSDIYNAINAVLRIWLKETKGISSMLVKGDCKT